MSMSRIAAICAFILAPISAFATTIVTGTPNVVQLPSDNGPCTVFQVGTLNEWFAVPTTDIGFADESKFLTAAFINTQPVTFTDAGTTVSACQGYELAQNISFGGLFCPNTFALDLTNPCDVIAAVEIGGF